MAFVPNPLHVIQELSHSEKLSRIVTAIEEAIHDGVSPRKVDEVVQSFLSKYRPFPDQNYLKGTPIPADIAALNIPSHIANTNSSLSYAHKVEVAQRKLNNRAAAAGYPNARSLDRGLPYYSSALKVDLDDECLDAAAAEEAATMRQIQQNRPKQEEGGQVFAGAGGTTVDDEQYITLNTRVGPTSATTQKWERKPSEQSVRNSAAVMAKELGDDSVTLNSSVALGAASNQKELGKRAIKRSASLTIGLDASDEMASLNAIFGPAGHQKVEEKEGDDEKTIEVAKRTTKKGSSVKKLPTKKPSSTTKNASIKKSKPTTAATATVTTDNTSPTTPAKRGRPVGYRKQANGEMKYPDGTRVTPSPSKSKSSNGVGVDGGSSGEKEKKRKAPATAVAINPNRKRQRQNAVTTDGAADEAEKQDGEEGEGKYEEDSDDSLV